MVNEENLNKMYESILKEQELTTKELNGCGFNSKDLADLIESEIIERIRRGYYSFKAIDNLFYYGKKLISMKEYDKATMCFEKCYELDSNHSGVCFQLFLRCIQNKNYEKAFEYFNHIYNTDNKYYNADSNYYLYLLSIITELPENHRQYAKFLKLEDVRVDFNDKRYNDIPALNKVRILSLNQKFVVASKQLNELIKQNGRLSVQDIITKTLLSQAIEKQNRTKKHIVKLINEKRYEEVIEYLETLQEQHNLSLADEYILTLTKDLTEIIKTGIIQEKQVFSTDKIFDAISDKNYELALSLNLEYIRKNNIEVNDNAMYLLLTEINNLIANKKNVSSVVKKQIQEIKHAKLDQKNQKQIIPPKTTIVSSSCGNSFADIIEYLMKNDFDNCFRTLRNYLDSIEKKQYEFLIIDLIKISLIEGDTAFTKPMVALTHIARENFEFNISEYIQNFYETLAQNKFDRARIYLDIISRSNNLGQSCILTEGLETVLNNTEKMLNYQGNNEILDKVEQSIQNIKNNSISINISPHFVEQTSSAKPEVISSQSFSEETSMQKKEQSISKTETNQPKNKDYNDYEFIHQKLETLYEKGILLLRPMDSGRRKGIQDIVKNIPDVVSFNIGPDNSRQIVLRFKPYINGYVDLKKISRAGNEAYKNGDYDDCISAYRQLLEFGEPKSFVYARLGLAYMKKFDKDTAISYLTVATELNKNENGMFDFTELIASLNGLISEEDKKPHVRMSASDFENDVDDYYGIDQVEQIAKLVSSGMTIDDACLNVGLADEQKAIVALIFAKECYAQENYIIGDQYLKKVERTRSKSKFINSLFEEVRRNKRFYKNRIEEGQKRLLLIPKIKK